MIRNLKRLLYVICHLSTVLLVVLDSDITFSKWLLYAITVVWLLHAIMAAAGVMKPGMARDYHLPWWFDVLFAGAMLTAFVISGWWWCAGAWALILLGVCDSNSREEEA